MHTNSYICFIVYLEKYGYPSKIIFPLIKIKYPSLKIWNYHYKNKFNLKPFFQSDKINHAIKNGTI